MTISEHLHFSVLTAPVAAIDRRALSQAWYSALYRTSGEPQPQRMVRNGALPAKRSAISAPVERPSLREYRGGLSKGVRTDEDAELRGPQADRRAPRSALARKIERALLHPAAKARKGFFTIEGSAGRVHILLREQGLRVKLIAICTPRAKAQVAAALAQARYALAQRGVQLEAQTREDAAC